MYVNRETGLAPESPSDHDQERRLSLDRVREAGSQWWLVRRRQRSGVANRNTVDDVQQQASQRRNSSGPYSKKRPRRDTITIYVCIYVCNDVRPATPPSHSTPLVSTATPVDGSTISRPSTNSGRHSRLSGDSHGRQFVSSSGSATRPSHSVGLTHRQLQRRLRWLLSFATGTAQLLELSSNHTISRFTLTGSQNYSDGPQHAAHSNISTQ